MINRVTITGADNSIQPKDLIPLTEEFRFVEWAILVSNNRPGNPRYPTEEWINELSKLNLPLAGHICGAWVRDLVIHRNPIVFQERPEFLKIFPRIQLNFSPYHAAQKFLDILKQFGEMIPGVTGPNVTGPNVTGPNVTGPNQFIFQVGSKGRQEKEDLLRLGLEMNLNLAVLFDRSGGKGVLPSEWPQPIDPFYCGYAGGLGPDSLEEQLPKIMEVVGERTIWIDMESRVRSEDNQQFDLQKVRTCLEICKPWVGV